MVVLGYIFIYKQNIIWVMTVNFRADEIFGNSSNLATPSAVTMYNKYSTCI